MCLRSRTALTAELRRMPLMSRRRCRRRCRRMFFVDRDLLRPHLAIGETHTICGLRTRKHNLRDTELDCSVTPRDSGTGTDKVDIGDPAPAFDEVRPVPNGRTNPRDAVSRPREIAKSRLVANLNVDGSPTISQRFNDSTIQRFNDSTIQRFNDSSNAMLVFLRDGAVVDTVIGAQPEYVLRSAVERLTSNH